MTSGQRLTKEDLDKMKKLKAQGLKPEVIAKRMRVHPSTVYKTWKAL